MDKLSTSTLSAKGQTTIPAAIRRRLGIRPGDTIKYEVEDGAVRICKVEAIDIEWARALESTLTEWSTDEDDDL